MANPRGEGRTEARDLKTVALWICPECGRLGPIGAYEPRCIGPEHEGIGEDLPAMELVKYVPAARAESAEKQRDEAEEKLNGWVHDYGALKQESEERRIARDEAEAELARVKKERDEALLRIGSAIRKDVARRSERTDL